VGLSDLFEDFVTADDITIGKPAPDIYLKAARILGIDPAKCLAVEDAPAGILAAQRAGMQVVTVPAPIDFARS
jgi:HAD superfamily hydrolase (TIGR01509 family)